MDDLEIRDLSIADFERNAKENRDVLTAIDRGLTQFNMSAMADPSAAPLLLSIFDDDNRVVGGVAGRSAYGWLRIDILWVAEELRNMGYGAELMRRAEEAAKDRACVGIHLDTHGFQAPEFYERLGYEVFGKLDDYPYNYGHFYFKKELRSDDA